MDIVLKILDIKLLNVERIVNDPSSINGLRTISSKAITLKNFLKIRYFFIDRKATISEYT